MIESIEIKEVATYGSDPQVLTGLSKFNFLFGSNGTGKTTVSRVIADSLSFPQCKVNWKGGRRLEPMVYNRDFVERNFNQSAEMKGVFTLGEKQVDTLDKIAKAKMEFDALNTNIERLTKSLQGVDGNGGKKGELATLETYIKDKCWMQKQKHDSKLQGAFVGYRNSAESFKTKVLQEQSSNMASLLTQTDLEKKAESVFGATPHKEAFISEVDSAKLIAYEMSPILKKRVIGKDDVDIAAMIKKLGNSDWVQEGRVFFDVNDEMCPFCQQKTTKALAQSLNDYFDEVFATDSKAIDNLTTNYATEAGRLQQQIVAIIASPPKFLGVDGLKAEKELFDAKIIINNQRLIGKKKEASQVVELDSVSNVFLTIKSLIDSANTQVAEHNKMVANLESERKTLTAQVWRFVLEELKTDLTKFKTDKDALDNAISSMMKQIKNWNIEKADKSTQIRELEKQSTSIQPTIDGINQLLRSFGFQGFELTKGTNNISYKLIRPNGSDAKATLSEGEKTFVTFLYFYYLLKGSESDSGMTTDRVVVFDDPVSSLDSDILFIVSSLIKKLFEEVRGRNSHIKQIFVLTHNVYFHKEVTYNSKRKKDALKDETFWIVRKLGLVLRVDSHPTNPIKTSYELLWAEVRKPDLSNLTIQNTLRRILENYFKILGGIELDRLYEKFDGKEGIICNSLVSWLHDGSHYAHDDLYISIDDSMVANHLKVFRAIFEKSGHIAHYNMMMGEECVEIPEVEVSV